MAYGCDLMVRLNVTKYSMNAENSQMVNSQNSKNSQMVNSQNSDGEQTFGRDKEIRNGTRQICSINH